MREFRWHILARWIWIAFLAFAAFFAKRRGYIADTTPLYAVCAGMALYNVVLLTAANRIGRWTEWASLLAFLFDIFGLTVYLHFSGDIENPLQEAYVLPVVAGAVVLSKRVGLLLAFFSSFLFTFLVCATYYRNFPFPLWHYDLNFIDEQTLLESVDPNLDPSGGDYIRIHGLWMFVLFFGAAYGFGSLAERVRAKERALLREFERLEGLLNALPVGVALLESDGRVGLVNPVASRILGDVVGRTPSSIDFGLTERLAALSTGMVEFEAACGGRILDQVLARVSPEGPVVWVLHDSTEQRRLQARMIHQAKMADIGLLAAGIAHEIGNPLSSMSALLQLLRMKDAPPEVKDRLKTFGSHLERIHKIVQDVTSFARPSAGRRTRATPGALIEKALAIFRLHEKSKLVRLEVPAERGPEVELVEDQIVQVLLNLLLNAADASPQDASVTLRIEEADGEARVSVGDLGAGMSAEAMSHLFTPFYTTKDPGKGVGLGLFVSETIIRAHGGRIDVRSAEGKGTTFSVCLPVASVPAAARG